jgi:hypothetical protein
MSETCTTYDLSEEQITEVNGGSALLVFATIEYWKFSTFGRF